MYSHVSSPLGHMRHALVNILHTAKSLFKDWHRSLTITPIAGVSNMCGAFVTNPVNVIKVRMQLNGALSSVTQVNFLVIYLRK